MGYLAEASIKAFGNVRVYHVVYEFRSGKTFEIEAEDIHRRKHFRNAGQNVVQHKGVRVYFRSFGRYQHEYRVERVDSLGIHTLRKVDRMFEKPFYYRQKSAVGVEQHAEQRFDHAAVGEVFERFLIARSGVRIRSVETAHVFEISAEHEVE